VSRKIDHDARKGEIARKALQLFSQTGYENVSLMMIAAATGISRTALYRYFCSKREVLAAAIATVACRIEQETRAILATRKPAMVRLELVCHAVVGIMFKNRDFVIAVFDYVLGMVRTGADMTGVIRRHTAGTRDAIRLLVEHGQRRREVPDTFNVGRIADAIYAEFESCAMRIVLGTEHGPAAAKVRFSDIIKAISVRK